MKDLYDTLGVKKNASAEEIKQAYRKKAVQYHPDKQGGDNAMMAELSHSYKVLSNPNTRDRYDKTGKDREDPFDQKFMGLVNDIMGTIIDQANVDEQDIIDIFKEIIDGMKKKAEEKLKDFEKKMKKAESVKKRLTTSKNRVLINVIELNLSDLSRSIFILKEDKEFFGKALLVLKDYKYNFDNPHGFSGVSFPDSFFITQGR